VKTAGYSADWNPPQHR